MINTDHDWREAGLCAQTDPELWFPSKGGSSAHAKLTCLRCPVRDECLTWALANPDQEGIVGGYSEQERKRLRKGERFAPVLPRVRDFDCEGCGTDFRAKRARRFCTRHCEERTARLNGFGGTAA